MAPFCNCCGKPSQAEANSCSLCGDTIAGPPPQNPSTAAMSAERSQLVAQLTPVRDNAMGGQSSASASTDDLRCVDFIAAEDPQPSAASKPFAPAESPLTARAANDTSLNQKSAQVAPMGVPSSKQPASTATSADQQSFSPVSFVPDVPSLSTYQQRAPVPPNGLPPSTPTHVEGQPLERRSPFTGLIGIALVVILLMGAVVVGGVVYLSNKAREKVRAVAQSNPRHATEKRVSSAKDGPEDLNEALEGMLSALSAGGNVRPVLSSNDSITPCSTSAFPAQEKAKVPFAPGTVLTTAWGIKYEDAEARNSIDSIDEATVTTTTSYQDYKDDNEKIRKPSPIRNQNCSSDYQATSGYMTGNSSKMPRLMHDVTRFRLSDKTFQEIKSSGQTKIQYVDFEDAPNGIKLTHEGGLFTRIEPQDVLYPMIVNDQRVELPAIHLTAPMTVLDEGQQSATRSVGEIFVLDDAADPLILNFRLKNPIYHNGNFRLEIIKINFPMAKPENVLEKQLIKEKRAVTYGIYFDFNEETLKPESEPVLKEIAQAMTDNPDWNLTVEGHTDNIGGDTYNLDLSKRRAASVKQALVSRYRIASDRLLTTGYGASRPVEANDTLQGRARNRRVELVRE